MAARVDLTTDPDVRDQLLLARRGTAFFARKLSQLSDDDLDAPSLLAGWTRRHVVAHVGYNARAIARLVEWAHTGVETPMYESVQMRNHEIDLGSTLSPIALRNLYDHSAVHLSVEWRDLPDESWSHTVRTIQGRDIPASETVWMRTREVWIHAVDLDNGATFREIPSSILVRLLHDITGSWNARGSDTDLVLHISDVPEMENFGDVTAVAPTIITGTLAGVTQWAAGRGATDVHTSSESRQAPPAWI